MQCSSFQIVCHVDFFQCTHPKPLIFAWKQQTHSKTDGQMINCQWPCRQVIKKMLVPYQLRCKHAHSVIFCAETKLFLFMCCAALAALFVLNLLLLLAVSRLTCFTLSVVFCFYAIMLTRTEVSTAVATAEAITIILRFYLDWSGAVFAVNVNGEHGRLKLISKSTVKNIKPCNLLLLQYGVCTYISFTRFTVVSCTTDMLVHLFMERRMDRVLSLIWYPQRAYRNCLVNYVCQFSSTCVDFCCLEPEKGNS